MNTRAKQSVVLVGVSVAFAVLFAAFLANLWGHVPALQDIPLVDDGFTNTATVRMSGLALSKAEEDVSGFDCYACHEEGKELTLKFDEEGGIVLPEDHNDLVMGHGRHRRNDHCFNCHNEENLRLLQTRDGRQVELFHSTPLCGSCHGPTYRDWEAGAHGRTGGKWTREEGAFTRRDCVDCHDPHAPQFPPQAPAPGPYPLRTSTSVHAVTATGH